MKRSGAAGMLFSFSDPLWAALALSLFPSFFPPLSPQWGSPLMWGKRSGYCLSPSRLHPEAPPHLFTFLCPYLEISRFPPCVEWKHSHLLSRARKQGQLIRTLFIWPWPLSAGWEPCLLSCACASSWPLQALFCQTLGLTRVLTWQWWQR